MILLLFFRSLFFYICFYSSLLVYACFCLLVGPFLKLHKRYSYFLNWNIFVSFLLKFCCGIRVNIRGRENIPDTPVVIMSNHQSPWETIYLYYLFTPVSAILKKELLRIPFFGWALSLLKPIAIDRSRKFSARHAMIEQGKDRLTQGISVLIFPEGTRLKPGENKAYQSGGSTLAIEAGVRVLPVAHDAGHYWPGRKFLKYPGTIEVVVGSLIDSDGKSPRQLTQEVERWVKQAL